MKSLLTTSLLLLASLLNANAQLYQPDILGNRYEYRTIQQPDDYEGKVICTVIRQKCEQQSKKALLYVHGYNDYFFQKAMGDSANAHGFNFYALDLRKYGRSKLSNQDHYYTKKVKEFYPDIDSLISSALQDGNTEIVLLAHSQGGLITSNYMQFGSMRDKIALFALNSPFLDWYNGKMLENVIIPCASVTGILFPRLKVYGGGESQYANSLLKDKKGEWEFDTEWKSPYGYPKRAGWVRMVNHSQQKLQKGFDIKCPILVMSSDTSVTETSEWNEAYRRADIVLDVKDIQRYGKKLGKEVTIKIIPGGKHDLFLSEKDARDLAYKTTFEWIEEHLK